MNSLCPLNSVLDAIFTAGKKNPGHGRNFRLPKKEKKEMRKEMTGRPDDDHTVPLASALGNGGRVDCLIGGSLVSPSSVLNERVPETFSD